jgi:hypothetical protein
VHIGTANGLSAPFANCLVLERYADMLGALQV